MGLGSPEALRAALALHAKAQARQPEVHTPGLSDRGLLPEGIGEAWDALVRLADVDHALLCPAFSFVLHAEGALLAEGASDALPTRTHLPWQDDPDALGLCARGLDLLPPGGLLFLDAAAASGHQRLLLAQIGPTGRATFGHLLRRDRLCALLAFVAEEGRFRLVAAARR